MKRREVFNSNAPSRWQRVKRDQTRYHDDALDDVEPCHVHSYSTTILNMKRREVFNSNAPSRWQRVKRDQTRYHDDALDDVEPCHVHSYSTTILNMKRREGVNSNAPSLLQRVKRDQSPFVQLSCQSPFPAGAGVGASVGPFCTGGRKPAPGIPTLGKLVGG